MTQCCNSITTANNIVRDKCLVKIEIGLNFFYCVYQPFFAAIISGLFFHFEAKCKFRFQMISSKEYLLDKEKPKTVCLSSYFLLPIVSTQTVLPDEDD